MHKVDNGGLYHNLHLEPWVSFLAYQCGVSHVKVVWVV